MSENHTAEKLSEPDSDSGGPKSNGTDVYQDQVENVDVKDEVSVEADDGMFVDCPDELVTVDGKQKEEEDAVVGNEDGNVENQVLYQQESHFVELDNGAAGQLEHLLFKLEKTAAEKESIEKEYGEEREIVANGVFDLHYQLKTLTGQQSLANEAEVGARGVTDVPLRDMIKECLEFVKTASEERLNSETSMRNLHEVLSVKDHEIENLNLKVSLFMASSESLQVSSEAQLEKDHNIDIVLDRTMSSLATVVNQEQALDNSISGKLVYIEGSTALLIEKYNQILSEIYQLGESLSEVGLGTREQEYGNILVDARGGLLELKKKEEEFVEKLSHLEDENRKLVEELDRERTVIGTLNTELGNMKVELEQEKVRCANTKEKLSMAVTKGKALVQQRDSLKTSLANKSSELEKCSLELQEKSAALEAAELTKAELARTENVVASLQNTLLQNNTIFEQLEEILSHAETSQPEMSDMPERLRWLVDDRNTLKGAFLELRKLKEALSLVDLPESVSSSDLESQMNWLVDDRNTLKGAFLELHKLKEALSLVDVPESVSSSDLESQMNWLVDDRNTLKGAFLELHKLKEALSLVDLPESVSSSDLESQMNWLVDDRNTLKGAFLELRKLKEALSLVDLPESVSSSDLESQMNWLTDYFHKARHDMYALQEDISTIKEASLNYVDRLSISLLLELQEKHYLQSELTDLRFEYEELVGKNNQISMEKDQIVKMLVDFSGLNMEDEGFDQSYSNTMMIIDLCFQNIKGQSGALSRASHIDPALFEQIQTLLYVRDQSLMLYEDILEEEMLIRSDVNKLSNEFNMASEEIIALKEERSSLMKDLERSEEKTAMLRDKLSMAVKKGKGLVQDRDNLKGLLNEKNSEIEQLKVDLQKKVSAVSEYRDEINRLSMECIPKLEADLLEIKKEKDRFEEFLLESNNMLHRVMECIDGVVLPVDPIFDEPIEKVKWLAGYVNECQDAKARLEKEVQLVKEEASILEIKLAEAQENVNSLQQKLSLSEDTVPQLVKEKEELELRKAEVEEELQTAREKVAEVCSGSKSLEDALSQAEKDISALSEEKEQAQVCGDAKETELQRVKDEAARQTSELAEAIRTIKDLEGELSQVESNFNLLTEKYNADQVVKTDMENELKKLHDEASNNASKSVGASATIKSLEDALLKAQDDISVLEDANKIAKQEISLLSSKLNSYMDESTGKNESLENKSLELVGLLNDLQVLMKDNTLLLMIKQRFEKKCETLKNVDLMLSKIKNYVAPAAKDSEEHLKMEEDTPVRKTFSDGLENFEVELDNLKIDGTDIDTVISSFGKIVKGFQLRNKHITDMFDEFSYSIDELISPLQGKLLETETNMVAIVENTEILKERANTMAKLKEEKDNIITTLENDVSVLLSACTDSASELQNEVDKNLWQLGSISEVENLNNEADELAEHHKNSKYADTSRKLINARRKVQTLIRQFEFKSEQAAETIEDLQNKLNETTLAFESVIDERDLSKNRVLQLESDIQLVQNSSTELKDKLEGYHALEEKLKENEAEISSMHSALLAKKEESTLLSASQVRDLFDKIDRIKIPIVESDEDDTVLHTSDPVMKLFYIIDSVTKFHHQLNSLSRDKKEMQLMLETKVLEIKDLKEEVKQLNQNHEDSKMVKNELYDLTFVLEKIIDIFEANNWVVDRKSKGVNELVPLLEKHIISILSESENSKSKAQELGIKLVGCQKFIDELTTKVKSLEDSLQNRISQPDIVQERSIFEPPPLPSGSEITEVEEASLGKKTLSPVASAAHVRNMRKGSTDHLALDINMESAHLISSADTDDDKGHAFKSLNTSGFVPKQGKVIADRIDGFWVNGNRALMNRPRARLGIIGYLLIMHMWLLVTIF